MAEFRVCETGLQNYLQTAKKNIETRNPNGKRYLPDKPDRLPNFDESFATTRVI